MTYATSLRPLGYQQITSLSSAVSLTVPAGTSVTYLKPSTQAIRFRDDGTDPTAAIGYPIANGSEFRYEGNPASLRLIEQTASAILNVLYYGA